MKIIIKYTVLFFVYFIQHWAYSQVGNYTKIDKVYRDTYNFLEGVENKQYKDKSLYIVYSDRNDNNSYLDNLGLKQGEQQKFLAPYFVINEKDDFLELVKFDPSQIGKPKGLFSFFYGETYNFQDVKNIEYIGWVQKDKLLHFSHSKVSDVNLKPLVFYLAINDTKTLFNFKKHIKKDSITAYTEPSFKTQTKTSFNTNQLVYLYKYNTTKTAALISNFKHIREADSTERNMGWVPSQLVKNIGQRKVWKINKDQEAYFVNPDSTSYTIKGRDIKQYIYQEADKEKIGSNILDSLLSGTSVVPLNIWDHYNNKLINIKGGDIYLRELPLIKKEKKVFNIHLVFDCNPDLRQKLLLQISSLQRIWLLISDDERYKDYNFTFSASSFGCNSYYNFPKNNSFALWVDYLQKVFINDGSITSNENNLIGIEKCFSEIISKTSTNKSFENNIVLIFGEESLNFNLEKNTIINDLSKFSTQLLFLQLDNKADDKHQDYILKAKQVLDITGKKYYKFITNYIIENEIAAKKNEFISLESDENNIYIYNAPKKSIYNGGLVFPKMNSSLSPVAFNIAFDSLLSKTITSNKLILKSLEQGENKLGFLRSKPTERLINIIETDTISRNPILISKNHKDETYLESSKLEITHNLDLDSGYLLTKNELEVIIESYKSVIPLIDKDVKQEQRRALYKKYKAYYNQLNQLLFYKHLQKSNTIGELLEIKTGIKVRDRILSNTKITEVKQKNEFSNDAYLKLMKHLRLKITKLETIIGSENAIIYKDGSNATYYFVLEKQLF